MAIKPISLLLLAAFSLIGNAIAGPSSNFKLEKYPDHKVVTIDSTAQTVRYDQPVPQGRHLDKNGNILISNGSDTLRYSGKDGENIAVTKKQKLKSITLNVDNFKVSTDKSDYLQIDGLTPEQRTVRNERINALRKANTGIAEMYVVCFDNGNDDTLDDVPAYWIDPDGTVTKVEQFSQTGFESLGAQDVKDLRAAQDLRANVGRYISEDQGYIDGKRVRTIKRWFDNGSSYTEYSLSPVLEPYNLNGETVAVQKATRVDLLTTSHLLSK